MKAIIPEENMLKTMQTPEDAKEAARHLVQHLQSEEDKKKNTLIEAIEHLKTMNPELGGMEEIAMLLTLPDESFVLLAPIFLDELDKTYHNVNNQLEMVQLMNIAGYKSSDIQAEYLLLCNQIDNQLSSVMSYPKRDFLKRIMGMTYNAVAEAEGVGKKTILIPIEFCHPDAKMPAYANFTDAGMDVFALEDITIAPGETKLIPIGIKMAVPTGYEIQVRPKSGRCLKTKLRVANTPGTIDSGYRDEVCVIIENIEPFIKSAEIDENGRLYNVLFGKSYTIGKGEKFAQLVLNEIPKACFYEVQDVGAIANDGRSGGFGSTGLK
jgi:dUTP pyrophosphatase